MGPNPRKRNSPPASGDDGASRSRASRSAVMPALACASASVPRSSRNSSASGSDITVRRGGASSRFAHGSGGPGSMGTTTTSRLIRSDGRSSTFVALRSYGPYTTRSLTGTSLFLKNLPTLPLTVLPALGSIVVANASLTRPVLSPNGPEAPSVAAGRYPRPLRALETPVYRTTSRQYERSRWTGRFTLTPFSTIRRHTSAV